MTAKYFAILTNYGAAQLANAVALGTQMNISAMAVGDGGGTLPVPDPAQTKLVRETRRAAVNQVSIDEKNPNFIIAEQVIPENEGGWWIREIGLFDDTGGLIAVGNAPETYKPNLQEGSGRTQVIQMVLMVSSTQAITLKVDPSVVLATREYVTKSIDAAIQESETKAARIYATKSELSTGLSGKQPTGDYATRTELNNGLSGKQPTGDYATKTEVNSKLTKDQNGADIPNKDTFIKNLGLSELLNKKFDKTGGTVSGQVDIASLGGRGLTLKPVGESETSVYLEGYLNNILKWWLGMTGGNTVTLENTVTSRKMKITDKFNVNGQLDVESNGGRVNTLKATAGTSVYQELYLQAALAAWWGITNSNKLSIANVATGNTLTIGTDGFKIDGKNIATTDQLFGVGQTYRNLTTSRQNKVWYTNTDSKPRIVHVETNRTGTQYPFSIDIQVIHNGVQHRADYRWTTADEVICLTAVIPPGARYSVNGGWGQPTEWTVINFWLEYSL
ncbi:phage tail protein [Morganella morganii]|uniref:phage tail protein n=3 Tax=Morganella morganii TaxID=582 RepID=UPI001F23DAFE|nr:phage tail protein [Morganella morganii]